MATEEVFLALVGITLAVFLVALCWPCFMLIGFSYGSDESEYLLFETKYGWLEKLSEYIDLRMFNDEFRARRDLQKKYRAEKNK